VANSWKLVEPDLCTASDHFGFAFNPYDSGTNISGWKSRRTNSDIRRSIDATEPDQSNDRRRVGAANCGLRNSVKFQTSKLKQYVVSFRDPN
jgi:hypothetical protein